VLLQAVRTSAPPGERSGADPPGGVYSTGGGDGVSEAELAGPPSFV